MNNISAQLLPFAPSNYALTQFAFKGSIELVAHLHVVGEVPLCLRLQLLDPLFVELIVSLVVLLLLHLLRLLLFQGFYAQLQLCYALLMLRALRALVKFVVALLVLVLQFLVPGKQLLHHHLSHHQPLLQVFLAHRFQVVLQHILVAHQLLLCKETCLSVQLPWVIPTCLGFVERSAEVSVLGVHLGDVVEAIGEGGPLDLLQLLLVLVFLLEVRVLHVLQVKQSLLNFVIILWMRELGSDGAALSFESVREVFGEGRAFLELGRSLLLLLLAGGNIVGVGIRFHSGLDRGILHPGHQHSRRLHHGLDLLVVLLVPKDLLHDLRLLLVRNLRGILPEVWSIAPGAVRGTEVVGGGLVQLLHRLLPHHWDLGLPVLLDVGGAAGEPWLLEKPREQSRRVLRVLPSLLAPQPSSLVALGFLVARDSAVEEQSVFLVLARVRVGFQVFIVSLAHHPRSFRPSHEPAYSLLKGILLPN